MGHLYEAMPLNGAEAYGSSLSNPFVFSDEELLLHVTPEEGFAHRHSFHNATSVMRSRNRQILGRPPEGSTGRLSVLKNLLDAAEASSVAKPNLYTACSEAPSKSTCSPSSPACLASLSYSRGILHSEDQADSHPSDLQHIKSGVEDTADHREKNRVAQKKFRARQKVETISCP